MQSFFNKCHFKIAILFVLIAILYQQSLSVPYYLDDLLSIENNNIVKSGNLAQLFQHYGFRFIAYLSFWGDFQISGSLTQFHVSNIFVHLLTSLSVFRLIQQIYLLNEPDIDKANLFAFIASLVFAIHPLQSQAVVYIVQRTAMLVTLFYLLSVLSYIKFRIAEQLNIKLLWFTLFVLTTCLALFTKQNSFTIPLVLFLAEVLIIKRLSRNLLSKTIIACSAILFLVIATDYISNSGILNKLDAFTRENDIYTRWQYFCAQLNILWIYIGKFFWPWPLRLEYGYAIDYFSTAQTIISAISHIALILASIVYRKKLPLFSFGILFFYITHGIESSIIPIKDLAFEHRMYLPILGLIIAILSLLQLALNRINSSYKVITFVVLTVILSINTYKRVLLWQDPIAFYQHELKYLPNNCRILNNIAAEHYKLKQTELGNKYIARCFEQSDGQFTNYEFVSNYLAMLISQKDYQKAESVGLKALKNIERKEPFSKRRILENLGILYMQQNDLQKAEKYFKAAVKLPNPLPKTYFALSVTLAKQAKYEEAKHFVIIGLQKEPENRRGKIILSRLDKLVR